MHTMRASLIVLSFVVLTACGGEGRDYQSSARCKERGMTAGTPEFERCVDEEAQARMMEEQRRDYEQRKQQDEDWRRIRRGY
jgi:hypothetical protein